MHSPRSLFGFDFVVFEGGEQKHPVERESDKLAGFNILKDNWGLWKQHRRTLIGSFMARRIPRVLTLEQS
ncbi:hypothetical protein TNCV_950921 [Trichonephila clavipes]|nr:hypothetical protein TNCV_950921 [Trichonephila clavipes]